MLLVRLRSVANLHLQICSYLGTGKEKQELSGQTSEPAEHEQRTCTKRRSGDWRLPLCRIQAPSASLSRYLRSFVSCQAVAFRMLWRDCKGLSCPWANTFCCSSMGASVILPGWPYTCPEWLQSSAGKEERRGVVFWLLLGTAGKCCWCPGRALGFVVLGTFEGKGLTSKGKIHLTKW